MVPTGDQLFEVGEGFFAVGIDRAELDALSFEWRDAAGGQDFNGKVQRQRTRMKQIQRPEVNRASGQIGATGGMGGNRRLQGRGGLSRHAKFVSRPPIRFGYWNTPGMNRG